MISRPFLNQNDLFIGLLFIVILIITSFSIVLILKMNRIWSLHHSPNDRSSHKNKVAGFGGIAFYINSVIAIIAFQSFDVSQIKFQLLTAITLIFALGFFDDLKNWSHKLKVPIELFIIILFLWASGLSISNLNGFLFIHEIPPLLGTVLSTLIILFLIQAYNLIDGIDGFASVVGSVLFFYFGFLFWTLGDYFFLGICVTNIASLFAFFWFNISHTKKIFMGDTGSLVLGFTLGIITVRLLGMPASELEILPFEAIKLPYIIIFIVFVPTFDVLRIIFLRGIHKKPIFSPDRNHLHHIISDFGLSHRRTSVICGMAILLIIYVALLVAIYLHLGFLIAMLLGLVITVAIMLFRMNTNHYAKRTKVIFRRVISKLYNSKLKTVLLTWFF